MEYTSCFNSLLKLAFLSLSIAHIQFHYFRTNNTIISRVKAKTFILFFQIPLLITPVKKIFIFNK